VEGIAVACFMHVERQRSSVTWQDFKLSRYTSNRSVELHQHAKLLLLLTAFLTLKPKPL
jgi:hypothetical protein